MALRAPGRHRHNKKGMVLAIEPGIYWPGGGGLRLEDNFLITETGNEKMCTDPDDFRLA
jgi:Xaa-Pro aminopeptidase